MNMRSVVLYVFGAALGIGTALLGLSAYEKYNSLAVELSIAQRRIERLENRTCPCQPVIIQGGVQTSPKCKCTR